MFEDDRDVMRIQARTDGMGWKAGRATMEVALFV